MILQVMPTIFSILGYYYISKNPTRSYTFFIMLNLTLLLSGFQLALIVNIIFASYFLIKLMHNEKAN